jgi:hypothetical protein
MNSHSLTRVWSEIAEHIRWRGSRAVVWLGLRECLRPVMYWHAWYIFETPVTAELPAPYNDGDGISVRTVTVHRDVEPVRAHLPDLARVSDAEIATRFDRGDVLVVAYSAVQPVGCMWLSFASGLPLAFGMSWKIAADEAVRYDSYVLPRERGRRIHSVLNHGANSYARTCGMRRTLASISVLNTPSLRLARHYRRAAVMTLVLIKVRGLDRVFKLTFGGTFHTRFSSPS